MPKFIKNPKSGRPIMIDGPTYKKLRKEGIEVANRKRFPIVEGSKGKNVRPIKVSRAGPSESVMREIMEMDLFEQPPLAALEKLAKTPGQKRHYKKLMSNKGMARGSATRGWSLRAPQKGKERRALMERCGQKCFLGDGESFPICPSCELYEGECQCLIDCDGANAAFIRAQQWKYPNVSRAAQQILDKKCKRTPKPKRLT